jgi:hypothetical protein
VPAIENQLPNVNGEALGNRFWLRGSRRGRAARGVQREEPLRFVTFRLFIRTWRCIFHLDRYRRTRDFAFRPYDPEGGPVSFDRGQDLTGVQNSCTRSAWHGRRSNVPQAQLPMAAFSPQRI